MSDLISRSYILNIIEMWMKVSSYSETERNIMRAIDYEVRTAPSAEPGWIPVTERLPEKEGLYLISHRNGKVFLDKWLGYDGWDSFISVTAWMPLPEPYKEAGE